MSRSYSSIGDVLTLLRPEFPDITISKIRFLEAQGLVSPQRSPSGYRKFYAEDVERLRYVLIQQRDHFLPLKVIRDRLNGVTSDEDTGAGDQPPEVATKSTSKSAPSGAAKPVSPSPSPAPSTAPSSTGPLASSVSSTPTPVVQVANESASLDESTGTGDDEREPTVADVLAALQEVPAVRQRAVAAVAAAEAKTPKHASRAVLGITMTTAEISAETGLSEKDIAALVEFGILRQASVAGLSVFDENNVEIARAATGILGLGIEPRHLRQFRNSVDREMGLIEQLITPVLRQRNPEALERAGAMTDALVVQGDALRAALLQAEVDTFLSR